MIRHLSFGRCMRRCGQWARDEGGAQLVEFAVALPLLVVFVVGIFDFSGAFTLKQRLTNIARDASRTAALDPSNDVLPAGPLPASVIDVFQIVDNYLRANNVNDCGLQTTSPAVSGLTWTFTANGSGTGCPSPGLTLIVNRGYYFAANGTSALPAADCKSVAGPTSVIVGTCVSIQYPYPWRFGRVASLIGANDALPTQITAVGVALNEN